MFQNGLTIFGICFALFALIGVIAFPQQTLAQGPIILSDISDNPENNFVPGQIIVGLKNGPAGVESDIKSKGGKILEANDKLNALLVKVPNKAEDAFLEAIKNNPNVTFAVKNHVVKKTAFIPNDPFWDDQWNMKIIKADEAWSTQLGSTDVIVAVADTGVDYNHSDLAGRVILGPDFAYGDNDPMDGDGHGTHVAGTVGATTNNGIGVAGLAQVKILAIKVLDDNGSGSDWSVSQGITFAENNADIINLSLGCGCTAGDLPLTKTALDSAYSKDVLIVAAAGNSGSSGPHYPSDDPNVISVSATTKDDTLASYSNRGNSIELSAPGGDTQGGPYWITYVLSTYKGNSYAYSVGTSMASPHVAGVAALVLSQNPNLSNVELRTHLQNTADDLGSTGLDPLYGYGRVNAQTAVTTISSPPPTLNNPPTADANGPYSGTEDSAIAFDGSGSSDPDGDALTYSWDFGDGSTGTGVTPSHTYGWGDTFTVTLTISDGNASHSTTSTVTVTEVNDVPTADANGPYSGTVNEVITFDGSASFDPDNQDGTTSNDQTLTYSWSFGDGGSATVVNPSHTYTTTGTFTVTLVVNDGKVDSAADSVITTVNPPPPPTPSASLTVVDGFDQKNSATLKEEEKTYVVQASDDDRWETEPEFYTSYQFSDVSLPSGATISSVVVYVEHYEESGFKGGNLQWSVGSGWSTSPDVWDTITAPIHTQESNEALYSWDVTNVVTASNINATELLVKNNDNNKKTKVDHIYAEVTWSTGPPPDPNNSPQAVADTATTNEDTAVTINVLANDSDVDGDSLTISSVTQGANGAVIINAQTNDVIYTPSTDIFGTDSFLYVVSDGNGGTDTATVTVTVTAVNDAPDAVDDPATTAEDTPVTVPVLGNDSDLDGDSVTISVFDVTSTNGGTVTLDDNGTPLVDTDDRLTFTPFLNFFGIDTFDYTITDGALTDTATVTITVNAVNDAPSFTKGADETVLEDAGPQIVVDWATGISAGPADESGQTLTFNVVGNDNPGLFSAGPAVAENGDLSYTPAADANGEANITIELMDNGGTANGGVDTSPTQTFKITVAPVNDTPVVTTTSPADGATFLTTDSILFTATATDAEDGDLSTSILWSSDLVGVLGTGASITSTLTTGAHKITASATDSNATPLTSTASITITSSAPPALISISVTPADPSIAVDSTQQFVATGTYSGGTTTDITNTVTWGSSNTAVATISASALATAWSEGMTTISATSGVVVGQTILTVTAQTTPPPTVPPGEGVIISKNPDFSNPDDIDFVLEKTMYIKFFSDQVNFNDIKLVDEQWQLEAAKGKFTNIGDGTYIAELFLDCSVKALKNGETIETKLQGKIEDNSGGQFQSEVFLTLTNTGPDCP